MVEKYRPLAKAEANQKLAPKTTVDDKYADQCVAVTKADVPKYSDGTGTKQTGTVTQYRTYSVTQVNGGKLIGLTSLSDDDRKFVGWVKKTDVIMQDLRNCN